MPFDNLLFNVSSIQGRPSGGVTKEKVQFAKEYKNISSLEEICRELKPSVAIGTHSIHPCIARATRPENLRHLWM